MEKWWFAACLTAGALVGGSALAPRAVSGPTRLDVDTLPPLAEVWVDGQLQGKTPLKLEVKPGSRQLELRKSGFQPKELSVPCPRARTSHVVEQLSPRMGLLKVEKLDKGAELWLGPGTPQRLKGSGPWSLSPGDYELTAVRGKLPAEPRRFSVKPGKDVLVALQWPQPPALPVFRPPVARPSSGHVPAARPPRSASVPPPRYFAPAPVVRRPVPPRPAAPVYRYTRPTYKPPAAPAPLWTPLPPPPPAAPVGHPSEEQLFTPLP